MEAREIISEEESAALRTAEALSSAPVPAGHVQDLHADHWERILADRAPALESIADRMVSLLKASGRRFFRASLDVTAQPLRSVRWGAYARTLPAPASLNVLDIRGARHKGLVMLDADFLFVLVDVFFGGDGRSTRPAELIEFTPIEQRMARKFVEAMTTDLKQAWKPFLDLEFTLAKTESNPIFAGIASSGDVVSVARFAYVIGDQEHGFDIVLPAAIVEPLRGMNETTPGASAPPDNEKWRRRLRHDIENARVAMRAVLSGTEISLRDVAFARPGDVIYTDIPGKVVLYAGDKPLLEGTLGVSQGRNAVRIDKPVNRQALGETTHGRTKGIG